MKATIVDLRYRMKDVIDAIDRGETVVVLHRGKERAKLTPISLSPAEENVLTRDQPFFGMWSSREDLADPAAYVRTLRRNRQLLAKPSSKTRRSQKD